MSKSLLYPNMFLYSRTDKVKCNLSKVVGAKKQHLKFHRGSGESLGVGIGNWEFWPAKSLETFLVLGFRINMPVELGHL